jgi:AraC family transcriptional regulator
MTRLFGIGTFYGETESFSIADATLSEVRHERALALPSHSHEAGHFCLLLEGTYVEHSGPITIAYKPLTVAFLPPQTPHADTVGEGGCRFFIVEVGQRWMDAIRSYGAIDHLAELHGGEATWLGMRLYNEYRERQATSALAVESLLYELCSHIPGMRNDDTAEPAWLRDLLVTIQERFTERLELAALASDVNVHPTHLARAFRRRCGRPVGDYVAGLRIQYVCRRLVDSRASLGQIAVDAGFSDQSHLTRVFKSLTGVTPAAYRRRQRSQ